VTKCLLNNPALHFSWRFGIIVILAFSEFDVMFDYLQNLRIFSFIIKLYAKANKSVEAIKHSLFAVEHTLRSMF